MKRLNIFVLISLLLLSFSACDDDVEFPGKPGDPQIIDPQIVSEAFFGDSIPFSATVKDPKVPLSTLKAQLFYGDVKVSETSIRTKQEGTYSGKIFAPFLKEVPDGTATLKLVLQDIHFTTVEQEFPVFLTRPQFEYVLLVTVTDDTLRLDRKEDNLYSTLTDSSMPQLLKGVIVTPKYGANGNSITFGWENNGIKEGSTTPITFLSLQSSPYEITFNAFSYIRTPFTEYKVNGKSMDFVDGKFQADMDLKKGDILAFENILDVSRFWIDPDFFSVTNDRQIQFAAIDGKYRIIVEEEGIPYFRVQTLDKNGNKAVMKEDGTGAIWIAGWGIAKPAMTTGQPGWNPGKMLCMAPVEPKVYRMTVTASGEQGLGQIRSDWIGFKFFYQDDWGGEFKKANYAETKGLIPSVITISDSGDLGFAPDQHLEDGKTYIITIDCTNGPTKAIISIEEQL